MSRLTVATLKFGGIISLGLLTGLSYTVSTMTLPSLLLLPSASPAHLTFQHLRTITSRHQLLLSTISTSSLILAYIISPPRSRHPYLLWSALTVCIGFGREAFGLWKGKGDKSREAMEEWEVEGMNGEVLREGMEAWRGRQMLRTGIWGFGWAMCVLGLWGDGAI